MEFINRGINLNGEFVLYIEGDVHHGKLDDLKEEIARYVEDGGSAEDCFISEFNVLQGVQITTSRDVFVPLNEVDEDSEVQEEEFAVYLRGKYYDKFSDIQYAVECIERLLEEHPDLDLEEDVELLKNSTISCSYRANATTKVDITIPTQKVPVPVQTGGMDWESKNSLFLMQELNKIQSILYKREHDKNESSIDIQV